MKIKILTLFPEMLRPVLSDSILGRAIAAGYLSVELIDIRDYTQNKHRNTDDYPFGGGAGMVICAQPIVDAIATCDPDHRARRLYMSPRGRTLTQRVVEELAQEDELILLCGHYEGVDQRALDLCIDEELSIGDYVLTGGELAAMVVVDSVARLVPGVLGSAESSEDESFTTGLLEYPQYTRPAEFRGLRVPDVLLGGNHADIVRWRREKSLETTLKTRPELLQTALLTDDDLQLLERLKAGQKASSILVEYGISHTPLDVLETDAFPKRWFSAFVPEQSRKAAKKQCFSGRRHIGWLWQAFSMNFAPCLSCDDAISAYEDHSKENCVLYLPDAQVAFDIPDGRLLTNEVLKRFHHVIITDQALSYTFVCPNKSGFGPYFAPAII